MQQTFKNYILFAEMTKIIWALGSYTPINLKPAGGGKQGMGWGFDIFQKFAVKFPAHGQTIPVNCTKISPPWAALCPYTDRSHWQKNRLRFSLPPFTSIPQYLKTYKSAKKKNSKLKENMEVKQSNSLIFL